MKKSILFVFCMLILKPVFGQEFEIIPEVPVFMYKGNSSSGSDRRLMQYLNEHLVYPDYALQHKISGTVRVTFSIHVKGKEEITPVDVKVTKSVHPVLDSAAVRLIRSIPDHWRRASRGEYKPVTFNAPIHYILGKSKAAESEKSQYNNTIIRTTKPEDKN